MDNLISTIIFILPGFMLYFWIQMMGVNPVVKHTTIEFGALSALAWFPVVLSTIGIMNLYSTPLKSLNDIKEASMDIIFLVQFSAISLLVSFVLSIIYVTAVFPAQMFVINMIRKMIGKTGLSRSPSVWEEVFFQYNTQVVGVCKIGSTNPDVIGYIEKVARPFEAKRSFKLVQMDYCRMIVENNQIPIKEVFTDIDSGANVLIYDYEKFLKADQNYRNERRESGIVPARRRS